MKFFNKLVIAMLFTSALCVLSHGASVAYVEDGGAKHTFENIYDAIACLGEDGGKIYITSAVSLADGEEISAGGKVTVTADGGSLNFLGDAYLCGDFTFENITLGFEKSAAMLFCEGNDVTFGKGITTSYTGTAPVIYGGTFGGKSGMTYKKMCFSDYTLTVKSGTWYYVRGGNFRRIALYGFHRRIL